MKLCIDCNKPTNSLFRKRCLDCIVIRKKETRISNAKVKQYSKLPINKFKYLQRRAKKKGHEFNISFDEFMSLSNKPCHYCNEPINSIQTNRRDKDIGYVIDNLVSCCQTCSLMKGKTTEKEFILSCKKIAENFVSSH